ncbi:RagB/SusD family nutrient uptake outer membrane protein [Psychroflexus salinarum]|uniref:RagB/SusD family nutrient uptake outer membrane protein n=1 Tax=Psychroflexus salinarum TaxID=546024 RepID=A0ABW3GSW6_9FLAO
MKRLIKITLISFVLVHMVSCQDEFLVEEPSQFLTSDQLEVAAENNPDIVRGFLDGIYALNAEAASGGTTSHTDFGHKAYDLYSDMLVGDVALSVSTYGWYRADITEFQAPLDFTRQSNRQPWQFYYSIIRSANTVIGTLGGNDADPQLETNQHILGQAFALRAFSYFYLTQYFVNEYDPNAEVLPLLDETINTGLPKSTMGEVYTLMETDLNRSIDLLSTYSRPTKAQINQYVAKGLLAYVIASTKDESRLPEVIALTDDVIGNSGAQLTPESEALGGFNDLNNQGWLWGIDLNEDLGLGLISWWGQMDYYTYSYAWAGDPKVIDESLYDLIPADDIRKSQFNTGQDATAPALTPINKFYHPGRTAGGQTVVTTDYVYMRVAEMILLKAESHAKLNQPAPARAALKLLMEERVPDASYVDALNGSDLMNEIYLQTRIELWGEGKTYLAFKRNERTATRGENHLSFVGEEIPYNDERMTFEIPEREIQDNPFINTQN